MHFYFKQMAPCPSILDLGMQFIQITTKKSPVLPYFSPQQKFLEFVIVFQYAKGSFYLD